MGQKTGINISIEMPNSKLFRQALGQLRLLDQAPARITQDGRCTDLGPKAIS